MMYKNREFYNYNVYMYLLLFKLNKNTKQIHEKQLFTFSIEKL